jgi:hypothetical protein
MKGLALRDWSGATINPRWFALVAVFSLFALFTTCRTPDATP